MENLCFSSASFLELTSENLRYCGKIFRCDFGKNSALNLIHETRMGLKRRFDVVFE